MPSRPARGSAAPRSAGSRSFNCADVERALGTLEASVQPMFALGRHRDFFQQVHDLRQQFRTARLTPQERDRLWQRLNLCAEAAKEQQAHEFAQRNAENLARWRIQLTTTQGYANALAREIDELAARRGPATQLDMWQRRITEKQARLASVQDTLAELRGKIADVSRRHQEHMGSTAAGR